MEIRRASAADAADIAAVHVRTWQAAYAHVFAEERLAGLDVSRRAANWERVLRDGESVNLTPTEFEAAWCSEHQPSIAIN